MLESFLYSNNLAQKCNFWSCAVIFYRQEGGQKKEGYPSILSRGTRLSHEVIEWSNSTLLISHTVNSSLARG